MAFFTLQDELARRLVERGSAASDLPRPERQTKAFITSVVGTAAALAQFPGRTPAKRHNARRYSRAVFRMPEIYRGVQDAAPTLCIEHVVRPQAPCSEALRISS